MTFFEKILTNEINFIFPLIIFSGYRFFVSFFSAEFHRFLPAISREFHRTEFSHDEGSLYLCGTNEIKLWLERPSWWVYKILTDGIFYGCVAFYAWNKMLGMYSFARIYILPEMQAKGIASAAIMLCEKTVANATVWTLSFPLEREANRRCCEKAGFLERAKHRSNNAYLYEETYSKFSGYEKQS
ncbi:MAG: hypothetical protein LBJ78_02680 [Puniceicoccales bacterium]|jgi:GNAT superfamily N-acetyltransferase|nr:hypothetical protein [Puniceicoccales bacterium]